MSAGRRTAVIALVAGAVLLIPGLAFAHPLGNFTVNVYAGLQIRPDRIDVDYVVDMAEIPTFQALPAIDANGDGTASAEELDAWAAGQAPRLASQLHLTVAGRPDALNVVGSTAELRAGQGGLHTLRLEVGLRAGGADTGTVSFENGTFADRIGWREVSATADDGTAIVRSTVPAASISDRLLSYPQDRLQSPLRVTSARVTVRRGVSSAASAVATTPGGRGGRPQVGDGRFAALVEQRGALLGALALLLALGFGALHALGPGHGKTLMAAYLVGSDGRLRQAAAVGVAVAGMHTASVIALGVLVVSAERLFPVERVYGWLGLATGLVALGLGVALFRSRVRSGGRHPHGAEDHAHEHGAAGNGHEHPGGHVHPHPLPDPLEGAATDAPPLSRRGLVALALAGGILPSPSALVVLLASFSIGRTAFGLGLIAAFSVGMAATLVAVGAIALRARSFVERRGSRVAARLLPIGSAAGIVALGAVLTARALVQL